MPKMDFPNFRQVCRVFLLVSNSSGVQGFCSISSYVMGTRALVSDLQIEPRLLVVGSVCFGSGGCV
jgi:hypothetical protein